MVFDDIDDQNLMMLILKTLAEILNYVL